MVVSLRKLLGVPAAGDAFVLVGAPEAGTRRSSARTRSGTRARAALDGIPSETRDPLPDGRTRYSRPLPGRDRMYPETDVPPVPVSTERASARCGPGFRRTPEGGRGRGSSTALRPFREIALSLQRAGEAERFESLVGRGHAAPLVAQLLAKEIPATHGDDEPFDFPVDAARPAARLPRSRGVREGGDRPRRCGAGEGAPTVPDAVAKAGPQYDVPRRARPLAQTARRYRTARSSPRRGLARFRRSWAT